MRPFIALLVISLPFAVCTSIADIQGPAFRSPLAGQKVTNITGLVTAKSKSGFYISGELANDTRISNGLYVYTTSNITLAKVNVGDDISLSGTVADYRSTSSPNDLFMTELSSPTNITVLSSNNTITPVVLGKDRSPPTQQLSALDKGTDGFLSVPTNTSRVETVNATLQPDQYGLDFWESLEGQLVVIPSPVAIDFTSSYGETWIYGDWNVTGKNSRGGLTMTIGPDGLPDANPEIIIIGTPLDDTKNIDVAVGTVFSDITGVIVFQYGFFYILPLTAPAVQSKPDSTIPATNLTSDDEACSITLGDYNVENMGPNSTHLPVVATHIAKYLGVPDLVFLQEIQDDSGVTDDGTVIANQTLQNLVNAIANASNGVTYEFVDIAPVNDQDGGQPGGNIRQAYLYNPKKLNLIAGSPIGGALNATEVITDSSGNISLSYNPGRIDPTNGAWNASRKPLVAAWETISGDRFFTINLQLTSKLGSSSTQGDARSPVNAGSDQRTSQVGAISAFVGTMLAKDTDANVVVAGDCNEYLETASVFAPLINLLTDIDEVSNIDPVERYTYIFDGISEQLDHIFVSDSIKSRGTEAEHVHINNWSSSLAARASDHDPSVAKIKVCGSS